MKKRLWIILLAILVLIIVISISYIITRNNNDYNNGKTNNEVVNNGDVTNDTNADPLKYTNINIDSQLAKEILDFVPKYLQSNQDKMSNEYIIYAAICKLEKEENQSIDIDGFPGYKYDLVESTAKEIYGHNIEIQKQDVYNLPISYNKDKNAFCKYPMSFGSSEEFQVIKELKENKTSYKLTIYALNVDYDIDNFDHIFISTKDTFKLYKDGVKDENTIRSSMKEYTLKGIELDPTMVANQYKEELPLIEYELEKLDDRGTKYFVKNIKLIIN